MHFYQYCSHFVHLNIYNDDDDYDDGDDDDDINNNKSITINSVSSPIFSFNF